MFGEGEAASRFWPSLRRAALAGEDFPMTAGEQVRDFIPVEDAARQMLAACSELPEAGHPSIRNVGTGQPTSLKIFAEGLWKVWRASGQLQFGAKLYPSDEIMRYVPQNNAGDSPEQAR